MPRGSPYCGPADARKVAYRIVYEGVFDMNIADIVVVSAATLLLVGLGWFFFGPRRARSALVEGGV